MAERAGAEAAAAKHLAAQAQTELRALRKQAAQAEEEREAAVDLLLAKEEQLAQVLSVAGGGDANGGNAKGGGEGTLEERDEKERL
eukprot:849888-Prorocentrum_minimum.AAC.1